MMRFVLRGFLCAISRARGRVFRHDFGILFMMMADNAAISDPPFFGDVDTARSSARLV